VATEKVIHEKKPEVKNLVSLSQASQAEGDEGVYFSREREEREIG
jgi:hypothetical protein